MSTAASELTVTFHDRTHTRVHDRLRLDLASGKIR